MAIIPTIISLANISVLETAATSTTSAIAVIKDYYKQVQPVKDSNPGGGGQHLSFARTLTLQC